VTIKLNMQRTSNMLNAMKVIVKSEHPAIRKMLTGIAFQERQRDLEVSVSIPNNLPPGRYPFTLEATGSLDSKPNHIVVTSVDLELIVEGQQ